MARTTTASFLMLLGSCQEVDSVARGLEPSRARLAPVDRAQLDAASSAFRADWAGALDAARRGLKAAPQSPVLGLMLPILAVLQNRPREALTVLERTAPFGNRFGEHPDVWWSRTQALHALGSHRAELDAALRARAAFPAEWAMRVLGFEATAAAALGREALVLDVERERQRHPVHRPRAPTPGELMESDGLEFLVHGYQREGVRALERAVAWFNDASSDSSDSALGFELGRTLYFLHRDGPALKQFRAALTAGRDSVEVMGFVAAVGLRQRDTALTFPALRWPVAHPGPEASLGRARAAAVSGAAAEAVEQVRRALAAGQAFNERLHLDPDLASLSTLPLYRELISPRG